MQIIHGKTEFVLPHKSAIAIGKFDGIHLGHKKLIDNILEQKKNGYMAVIFTFEPSPAVFFSKKAAKELMTVDEKCMAFDMLGIDVLIEFPLNEETAATPPERFITEYLVKKLKASVIVAGTDISFGNKGMGNAKLLCEMAKSGGYSVQIIDKVTYEGDEISSTLIRESVSTGDMEKVTALLGTPYKISGTVTGRRKPDREPCESVLNIKLPCGKLLPPEGDYDSCALIDGIRYPAVFHVERDTVEDNELAAEAGLQIHDFVQNVCDRKIEVELLRLK